MMRGFHTRAVTIFFTILVGMTTLPSAANTLDRIQERGQLILGTSGNMPMMSQLDDKGGLTGLDIDIAKYMAQAMEVALVPRVMPFSELLPALEAGEVDVIISNMTITPKRNLKAAFVGPYFISGKCFITKDQALDKADQAINLNTAETRLAALKGSTSEEIIQQLYPRATLVTFESYADPIDQIKKDEIKGMLVDYPVCVATLEAHPNAGFSSLLSLITYEPIGIALPANDAQFINWTENFMQRMNGTGTLQGLSDEWFGPIVITPLGQQHGRSELNE